jgi:hypothetical protein
MIKAPSSLRELSETGGREVVSIHLLGDDDDDDDDDDDEVTMK